MNARETTASPRNGLTAPGDAGRRPSSPEDAADLIWKRAGRAVAGLGLLLLAVSPLRPAQAQPPRGDSFAEARREMVEQQIRKRGIKDPRVLAAMQEVPRHLFVPPALRDQAHEDRALPIGHSQNIYQPSLVAYMTSLLELDEGDRVLEIGTGSGYHTAVLSRIAGRVYTIEIIEELGRRAERLLTELGYDNIEFRIGDGYKGWSEFAPFDAILLTAAPPEIPQLLIDQLAVGGRMVAPVGAGPLQELQVIIKTPQGLERQFKGPYMVPPMRRDEEP